MFSINDIRGCGTALITPFHRDGKIDKESLIRLVDFQIDNGINFLVPCGTTGESATLTIEEHITVIELVLKRVNKRVPVIAGAGGNNTLKVIELCKELSKLDIVAILSVTPYYNKPTQAGLIAHYNAIVNSTDKRLIIYNVPGRTSVNILPETAVKLSHLKNIVAIKEASGDINQIAELSSIISQDFKILSGDDLATMPIISLGGVGVISVVSNVAPFLMTKLVRYCLESNFTEALKIQKDITKLTKLLFVETNPIPVKAALSLMGLIKENYRLPLIKISIKNKELLTKELIKLGLIK